MSSGGSLLSPSSWKHVASKLLTLACWRPRVKQPSRSIRSTWSGRASPVHITILYRWGWGSPGGSPGPSPGGPDDGPGESEPYLYTSLFCTGEAEAHQSIIRSTWWWPWWAPWRASASPVHIAIVYTVQVRLRLTRISSGPPGDPLWAEPQLYTSLLCTGEAEVHQGIIRSAWWCPCELSLTCTHRLSSSAVPDTAQLFVFWSLVACSITPVALCKLPDITLYILKH